MKRPTFIALGALLLLLAAAFVALRSAQASPGRPPAGGNRDSSADGPRLSSKSTRVVKGAIPPGERFNHLLALRDRPLEPGDSFEAIDDLAKGLTTAELLLLAEPNQEFDPFGGPESSSFGTGMKRWVRCAAFAELGRRDGESMVARMLADFSDELSGPALFSIFRGWAEVDASAAAARLLTTEGTYHITNGDEDLQHEEWREQAFAEVFEEWARLDPAQARLAAPPPNGWPNYDSSIWQGIFCGMQDPAQIRSFLAAWNQEEDSGPSYWYKGAEARDRDETEVVAALRLAEFGLRETIAWMQREADDPFSDRTRFITHVDRLLERYGRDQPARALALMGTGEFDPVLLADGVAWAHPERIGEALAALNDPIDVRSVLRRAIGAQASGTAGDDYPAPGRMVRTLGVEARYNLLLAEIESDALRNHDRISLRFRLNLAFRDQLPAARAALNEPSGE
jgi:hypothetical protein